MQKTNAPNTEAPAKRLDVAHAKYTDGLSMFACPIRTLRQIRQGFDQFVNAPCFTGDQILWTVVSLVGVGMMHCPISPKFPERVFDYPNVQTAEIA